MGAVNTFPELGERLRTIREQIRRKLERTQPPAPEQPLPAVERLGELRQRAAAQAGAIGTLNPRPGGAVNAAIQRGKRLLARISDWQFRPQREFNATVVESLGRVADALGLLHHEIAALQVQSAHKAEELGREIDSLCEHVTLQKWAYEGALARSTADLERATAAVEQFRAQALEEVRELRQRVAAQAKVSAAAAAVAQPSAATASTPSATAALDVDYLRFEHHFRGTEQEIRARQNFYLSYFRNRRNVLDIACGRGEFLELMRSHQIPARGVDLDADMVGLCLEKGLDVTCEDAFAYLARVPEASLDGIFSAQFVEHLEPRDYVRLIRAAASRLAPGGVLAVETQNPECLAIFSQTFYADPTHVRPIPPAQLAFLFSEAGLSGITVHRLSPASATLPVLPHLDLPGCDPEGLRAFNQAVDRFNQTFFDGMDYAVIGFRPQHSGPATG